MEKYPRSYVEENIKFKDNHPIIYPWGHSHEGGTEIFVIHYVSGRMVPLHNHQPPMSFSIIKIFIPFFIKQQPFGMIENISSEIAETYATVNGVCVKNKMCDACNNDEVFTRYHDLCSGQSLFHPLSYTLPIERSVFGCRKLCRFHIE